MDDVSGGRRRLIKFLVWLANKVFIRMILGAKRPVVGTGPAAAMAKASCNLGPAMR